MDFYLIIEIILLVYVQLCALFLMMYDSMLCQPFTIFDSRDTTAKRSLSH